MHGPRCFGADAESRAVFIGAATQVGDGAQKFVGMTLFLQGVGFGIGLAKNRDGRGADFPLLALAPREHQFALYADGGAGGGIVQCLVSGSSCIHDALHIG